MGLFGPFQNDPWNLPAQRPRARLQPADEDNSSAQVIWGIGVLLASALAIAALVGEALYLFHVN